jgi:hypothetical protein
MIIMNRYNVATVMCTSDTGYEGKLIIGKQYVCFASEYTACFIGEDGVDFNFNLDHFMVLDFQDITVANVTSDGVDFHRGRDKSELKEVIKLVKELLKQFYKDKGYKDWRW